ncbi:enoyl-CoA hydratase/isomerase family protein [Virgibacillus byunsanensis]|uniref:Enoyl-CoA hydratase/isomerase family protein n=1 Tax=Virgibacillus byunsanensis TaxID=570945 RepID=A0ABW3LNN9_9BACI
MSYQFIEASIDGKLGYITLNRPDKLNALSEAMWLELEDAVREFSNNDDVKVIIIRGAGRAFSAGFDITSEKLETVQDWYKHTKVGNNALYAIWNSKKPVIAQVHRHCLGGAHSLALTCDLIIASDDAKFGEPEVLLGTFAPFLILPWVVGMKKSKELLFTGDTIPASEAKEIGIVNKVVPRDQLDEVTKYMANKIALNDSVTNEIVKQVSNRAYEIQGILDAMKVSEDMFTIVATSEKPETDKFLKVVEEKGFKEATRLREESIKTESIRS